MRLRGCNPNACYPMASPIAHSFAGLWTFLLLTARLKVRLITACRQYLSQLVLLVLLANLPDIDFLFGLVTDANANALHRGFTHSLAAAFFVALAVACVDRKSTRLNSSHVSISYAVFCLKKKKRTQRESPQKPKERVKEQSMRTR